MDAAFKGKGCVSEDYDSEEEEIPKVSIFAVPKFKQPSNKIQEMADMVGMKRLRATNWKCKGVTDKMLE